MESSGNEVNNATPREVDLFAEEALEEVFETIDNLRAQFDQLQLHCEKLASEKSKVDQLLIDKEAEYQLTKEQLQQDITNLRKANLQLLASQKSSSKGPLDLGSFVLDSEKVYQEKIEAEAKVDALQLKLLEKDKYISSLEWQLVDSEAAIASLQAERDRLGLELDYALGREQDDLQALGAVGDTPSKDPLEHLDYGLVESGYVDDMPVRRVRKQPRRHFSDLTKRGNSYVDDFGAVSIVNASLSDYDVPTLAEKESNGLCSLKRAANFSNINNLDEHETFNDRASEADGRNHGRWESFDDTDRGLSALSKSKFGDGRDVDVTRNGSPDMWSFTPDSIINVSTGEELASVPPPPSDTRRLSKDCTTPAENTMKEDQNNIDHVMTSEVDTGSKCLSAGSGSNDIQFAEHHKVTTTEPANAQDSIQQVESNRRLSSSDMKSQDGRPRQSTRRSASDVSSNKRLEEYHKWKVSGCKGDPPAKLKISQC